MTVRVPRLPISLDPLMAEAKRRARQRRMLDMARLMPLLGGHDTGAGAAVSVPAAPSAETQIVRGMTRRFHSVRDGLVADSGTELALVAPARRWRIGRAD